MSKGTVFQSPVSKLLLNHCILAAHSAVAYDCSKSQEEVKKFQKIKWGYFIFTNATTVDLDFR